MCKNKLFEMVCDIYSDSYGNCSERNICLADLLGGDEMMRKCRNCGLDKEYTELYNEIDNKMKVGGNK